MGRREEADGTDTVSILRLNFFIKAVLLGLERFFLYCNTTDVIVMSLPHVAMAARRIVVCE